MLNNLGPEEKKKLIPVFILTDGNFHRDRINFFNKQTVMHKLFRDVVEGAYNTKISYYCIPSKRVFTTTVATETSRKVKRDLLGTVRSFKTSPGRLHRGISSPSINYLLRADKHIQKLALRIAMSSEGYFSITRRENGTIKGYLGLACAHPALVKQWKRLANLHKIDFNLHMDRDNWSGIHGLRTTNSESIRRFYEIGGFAEGLAVMNGNFKGIEKNALLKSFVKFNREEKYSTLSNKMFWNRVLRGVSGGNAVSEYELHPQVRAWSKELA